MLRRQGQCWWPSSAGVVRVSEPAGTIVTREEGHVLLLAMILATAVSIAPSPPARVRWLLLLLAVGAGIFALLQRQLRL
jgi:hypothetical protein